MNGVCAFGKVTRNMVENLSEEFKDFKYVVENGAGQGMWCFADANFGILDRDIDIAKELRKLRNRYGVPRRLFMNWAKNSSENILQMTTVMKDMVPAQIAVQSFDEKVVKNIKRKNLSVNKIKNLINSFHERGLKVSTDILVGCSGETANSHLETLKKCFDLGFDYIYINTIRVLPGSEIDSYQQRKLYGLKTQYRLIPNSYGVYMDEFVFEIEESIKASIAMTEEEMNGLRKIHFLIPLLWNSNFAEFLLVIGLKYGLNPLDVFKSLVESNMEDNFHKEILNPLLAESASEWFLDENSAIEYYSNPIIYDDIINGRKKIEKLIYKYIASCIINDSLIYDILNDISRFICLKTDVNSDLIHIVNNISKDRLNIDCLTHGYHNNKVRYEIDEVNFDILKELKIIPPNINLINGIFEISYVLKYEDVKDLKTILKRFDYKNNPLPALCAVFSNTLGSAFIYDME